LIGARGVHGDAALREAIGDAERGLIAAKRDQAADRAPRPREAGRVSRLASELPAYDDKTIAHVVASGTSIEVTCDEKAIP
jgi:hypothetical protein